MAIEKISCADTAKLIRKSLGEAFPDVLFSMKCHSYRGGAHVYVSWTDGPSTDLVEAITARFRASYFDGVIDYKGRVYHLLNGTQVELGADFVTSKRAYTDGFLQLAISRVYRQFKAVFDQAGIARPTLTAFREGELSIIYLPGPHGCSVAHHIRQSIGRLSDRLACQHSPTAASLFVTHDDGYSRLCGSGVSAVTV